MLSKSKRSSIEGDLSNPPAGKPRKSAMPSIFSPDLSVKGTVRCDGDIQFNGQIEGNIHSGSLTIGEEAVIQGEIMANQITIHGRVVGTIRAHNVQLSSMAHVEGEILHNVLKVESGAFFDGISRHSEDPLKSTEIKRAAADNQKNKTLLGRLSPSGSQITSSATSHESATKLLASSKVALPTRHPSIVKPS